jgi:DNA gyrase subunit A
MAGWRYPPLIELIADPRYLVSEDGTYTLSETQARAILDLRLQRLTALGRDEIGDELAQDRRRDPRLPRNSRLARPHPQSIIKDELAEVREAVRHAAPHRDHRKRCRFRG